MSVPNCVIHLPHRFGGDFIRLRVEKSDHRPSPYNPTRFYELKNGIFEAVTMRRTPAALLDFKKISKDEYVQISTGLVFEYEQHSETRADNYRSIRNTFVDLRRTINANFEGKPSELMITLTYAENMTDPVQHSRNVDVFKKRMKRRYPDMQYIDVVEPQGRGAWHSHILMRFDDHKKIYIPNDEIARLWGHGFTSTKRIKGVDNIGAYLSGYLCNIPADELSQEQASELLRAGLKVEEKEITDIHGNKVTKRIIKGGRLKLYPPGMKLYRTSRGIAKPVAQDTTHGEFMEKVGATDPDYSTARIIFDENNKCLNAIFYEQYNTNRKKSQQQNDPTKCSGRISNRSASPRQQSENPALLHPNADFVHDLCGANTLVECNIIPVPPILHAPKPTGDFQHNPANLHSCPACIPHMVLPRGLSSREHPRQVQASQGTKKNH